MSFLRLANTEERERFYYEDTEEYIEVRKEMSKREANGLLKFAPRKEDDLDGGMRFMGKAFKDLVTAWSLVDNDGNPLDVTMDNYDRLDAAAGAWIDRTLGGVIRDRLGADAEEAEKKLDDLHQTQSKELTSGDD